MYSVSDQHHRPLLVGATGTVRAANRRTPRLFAITSVARCLREPLWSTNRVATNAKNNEVSVENVSRGTEAAQAEGISPMRRPDESKDLRVSRESQTDTHDGGFQRSAGFQYEENRRNLASCFSIFAKLLGHRRRLIWDSTAKCQGSGPVLWSCPPSARDWAPVGR